MLTEVGRKNDMDNSHMLAIVEQQMSADDRKVWSRFLEASQSEATKRDNAQSLIALAGETVDVTKDC